MAASAAVIGMPTGADQLIGALRAHRPRLVFLSACLTAAAGEASRGGLPGEKESSAGLRGGVAHSLARRGASGDTALTFARLHLSVGGHFLACHRPAV